MNNKLTIAFIGLFAIVNGASLTVRRFESLLPATELAEWDAYKLRFGKVYQGLEERFRMGIFFATKDKIAKYDELLKFGLSVKKLELDSFADYTRDELFKLREELEFPLFDEEWRKYKFTFGKVYDSFEDRFRKTIYFIVKDTIEAHNKLYERGFSTYKLGINQFTDMFRHEMPGSYVLPSTVPYFRSSVYWGPYRGAPFSFDGLRIASPVEHFSYFTRGLYRGLYPLQVV